MGALAKLARLIASKADLNMVRDLIHPHVAPRSATPMDHQIISTEMLRNIEDDPQALTHVFHDQNLAKGAYQLSPRESSMYIPYIVSYEKGLGGPMLEDAYQNAKQMAPDLPVYLYATPESRDFYARQPNWVESNEDGISKFQRKARGGLVQMCQCGRK